MKSEMLEVRVDRLSSEDVEKVKRFWRRERTRSAKGSPAYNLSVKMLADLNDPRFVEAALAAGEGL